MQRAPDLLVDPIPGIIRSMAVPISIGMFFQTMYNVVDTWFAGRLSTEALQALSITFPVFFMLLAFGFGLGQATTVLVGAELGDDDADAAKWMVQQCLVFAILLSALLMGLGVVGTTPSLQLLGAEGSSLRLAQEYLYVLIVGTALFVIQAVANGALAAEGDTRPYRNVLIASFIANLVLDPLLVFGLDLGVRGLAISTVLAQAGGCAYLLYRLTHGQIWRATRASWMPRVSHLVAIVRQAFPASLAMLTIAMGIFVITWFISGYGSDVVAAYGVATRIEQILLLPSMGLTSAVLALTSQNLGAGQLDRCRTSWLTAQAIGVLMMLAAGGVLYLGAPVAMAAFTTDAVVQAHGSTYLRYASVALPGYPILFITTAYLQGLQRPAFSMYIGLFRQLLAPMLSFPLLAGWMQLQGIWLGIVCIVWFSAAAAVVFALGVQGRSVET